MCDLAEVLLEDETAPEDRDGRDQRANLETGADGGSGVPPPTQASSILKKPLGILAILEKEAIKVQIVTRLANTVDDKTLYPAVEPKAERNVYGTAV